MGWDGLGCTGSGGCAGLQHANELVDIYIRCEAGGAALYTAQVSAMQVTFLMQDRVCNANGTGSIYPAESGAVDKLHTVLRVSELTKKEGRGRKKRKKKKEKKRLSTSSSRRNLRSAIRD